MSRTLAFFVALGSLPWLAACPSEVSSASEHLLLAAKPEPTEEDPRVTRMGGELYPTATAERAQQAAAPASAEVGLGSGRPDESNGVCRLYAPEAPQPECCEVELGFDAPAVEAACGLPLYLGESFQFSCGYHFQTHDGTQAWFRLSQPFGKTVAEAAAAHDLQMRKVTGDANFRSRPLAGFPSVLTSHHAGMSWAFIPGWSRPRLLVWSDGACSPEGIRTVVSGLMRAKPAPAGAKRSGLIPRARA